MKNVLLLLLFTVTLTYAQEKYLYNSDEKNYVMAGVEALGTNVVVWSINRFIFDEDWTRISIDTWERNLNHHFVYDTDPFVTNQFAHPYHGSMYYTSARSNGLTFWESIPYTVVGSLSWEYFGETTLPSKNDFVGTTMGGIALGEMLFRLSNLVLDESATGSERLWREIGGLVISPIHGFNRLISGKMSRLGEKKANPLVQSEFAIGMNNVAADNIFSDLSSQLYLRLKLDYGNLYESVPVHNPFSYFSVYLGGNISKQSKIPEVIVQGVWIGKNIRLFGDHSSVAGLFQHYNFIDWNGNQISTHSLGAGIENEFEVAERVTIEAGIHLAYVVLGGSNLYYDEQATALDQYNYSNGLQGRLSFELRANKFGEFSLSYDPYWLNTIHPVDGNEFIGILTAEYDIPVYKNLGVGLEYKLYRRWGDYEVARSVSDVTSAVRGFVTVGF